MTFGSLPHKLLTIPRPSRITNIQYADQYSSARPSSPLVAHITNNDIPRATGTRAPPTHRRSPATNPPPVPGTDPTADPAPPTADPAPPSHPRSRGYPPDWCLL